MKIMGRSVLVSAGGERFVCSITADGGACIAKAEETGFRIMEESPAFKLKLGFPDALLDELQKLPLLSTGLEKIVRCLYRAMPLEEYPVVSIASANDLHGPFSFHFFDCTGDGPVFPSCFKESERASVRDAVTEPPEVGGDRGVSREDST
jgi:hypothetical protein